MNTGKWAESVTVMEKPEFLLCTGVPPGGTMLAARRYTSTQ